MKPGDRIKDHNGNMQTVAWMSGDTPMRKSGYGSVPIWTKKQKTFTEMSKGERLESRINHLNYELMWCNDDECRIVFTYNILVSQTELIKIKHCI